MALIALLVLGYAQARSSVMQTSGMSAARSGFACGESMPRVATESMVIGAMRDAGHQPAGKSKAPCPFCAATASPALLGAVAAPVAPTIIVFVRFLSLASLGPRGPPGREPRARGPPFGFTPA